MNKKAYISPDVTIFTLKLENIANLIPGSSETEVTDGVSGGGFDDKPEISEEDGGGDDV